MRLEGIVSKRLGLRYRSGRSKDWLKFKNPDAPPVKREAGKIGKRYVMTAGMRFQYQTIAV
jgi:ATP-dependent DNA ligase